MHYELCIEKAPRSGMTTAAQTEAVLIFSNPSCHAKLNHQHYSRRLRGIDCMICAIRVFSGALNQKFLCFFVLFRGSPKIRISNTDIPPFQIPPVKAAL